MEQMVLMVSMAFKVQRGSIIWVFMYPVFRECRRLQVQVAYRVAVEEVPAVQAPIPKVAAAVAAVLAVTVVLAVKTALVAAHQLVLWYTIMAQTAT